MSKYTPLVVLILVLSAGVAFAGDVKSDKLSGVSWLVGDWEGVAEGQPGTSASTRHARRVHNGNFIVIEGRSVYPKQEKNKSGEVHTSTDFWSFDKQRNLIVMRQFDNLGFVSTYVQDRAASKDGRLVLVSEHLENVPKGWKARFTYSYKAPDEYHELFELDSGKGFELYVLGMRLRVEQ